jgi:hypothetical protein
MTDRHERAVRNQTRSRELNEWAEESIDSLPHALGALETYVCECSDGACTEPISLMRHEYEGVRSVPVRFAIALDHENPESDAVVSENDRFAVVDKFYGAGMRIARATDPRR